MLVELHVRNLVIVEQARLEPGLGLTVISGETGAGKSLLLDALGLLLGGRAQAKLVGPAGDQSSVTGVFLLDDERAASLSERHGLVLAAGEVVLKRRIGRNGRSQAWIDDEPVSVATLRDVGRELVEVRVQHEHLKLSEPERQLDLLDRYGDHSELAANYATAHARCLELGARLRALEEGENDSLKELDYLRFLLAEIDELDPQAGELSELEQRQALLAGAQEWRDLAAAATDALSEADGNVSETLALFAARLQEAPDDDLRGAGEACAQALEAVRDAAITCAGAAESLHADPAELARLDQRLAAWLTLLRKHGGSEASLLEARDRTRERVAELEDLDGHRERLAQELAVASEDRASLGKRLAVARRKAFKRLQQAVHAELAELGMPKARLELAETRSTEPGPLGTVAMEWTVRTNPGMPGGPLRTVASGGEAARLTLAVATALAAADDTPVLVFDEIDSGVGGRLGAVMGAKLAALAEQRTVLVVTHMPQLAAAAARHYVVRKEQDDQQTMVRVQALAEKERLGELADMLGGGRAAQAQAKALLAGATAGR